MEGAQVYVTEYLQLRAIREVESHWNRQIRVVRCTSRVTEGPVGLTSQATRVSKHKAYLHCECQIR